MIVYDQYSTFYNQSECVNDGYFTLTLATSSYVNPKPLMRMKYGTMLLPALRGAPIWYPCNKGSVEGPDQNSYNKVLCVDVHDIIHIHNNVLWD